MACQPVSGMQRRGWRRPCLAQQMTPVVGLRKQAASQSVRANYDARLYENFCWCALHRCTHTCMRVIVQEYELLLTSSCTIRYEYLLVYVGPHATLT